jgi:hypothetical protein
MDMDSVTRKLIAVLIFLGCLAFARPANAQTPENTLHCPCTVGTSCTTDGGLVTAVCGIQAYVTTACSSGALYSYGSGPFSSFNGAYPPCMDVYYNTADGATNSNPTIVIGPEGGDATAAADWCAGFNFANGSEPAAGWGLIDGTAFAGTVAAGQHWNIVCPQTSSIANMLTNGAVTAGATGVAITNGGDDHFWPGTPYTICVDVLNQECFPVTSQTGSYVAPGTITASISGAFANNHASGVYVWAEDSNGQGGPAYPTYYKWSVCDYARVMAYLEGISFGNGQYLAWGISGTTNSWSSALGYWKSIANMAAPQGCGLSISTTAQIVAAQMVSPLYDERAEMLLPTFASHQSDVSPCENAPPLSFPAGPGYAGIMGAYAGTLNSGSPSGTVPNPLTYSNGALSITSANALAQAGFNVTLAGCLPGTANSCYYGSNADGYLGLVDTETSGADSGNPCSSAAAFLYSAPGSIGLAQGVSVGHGANFNTNESGSDCGTSTAAGGICSQSYVFKNLVAMIVALRTHGNVTRSGIAGAGIN